jgi:hypothetical protein
MELKNLTMDGLLSDRSLQPNLIKKMIAWLKAQNIGDKCVPSLFAGILLGVETDTPETSQNALKVAK